MLFAFRLNLAYETPGKHGLMIANTTHHDQPKETP